MHYSINYKGNSKTGPMPVTTSSKSTCPDTCPLKEKGCYAKYSFLGNYWTKLTKGEVKNSTDFAGLIKSIKKLSSGTLWRHNQAGDLPHNDGAIDRRKLEKLTAANTGKNGFTYTHHKLATADNALAVAIANNNGFTINASTNDLNEADRVFNQYDDIPVVTLLSLDAPNVSYTPGGNKVVACPAEKSKSVTCSTCKLCAVPDRDFIIGFRAHGTAKKSVSIIARG